ncbi:MAG: CapA family protein [Eubacteriales bacterium]|nr:CapA family protein [Eubacteriales bacterium]
MKFTNYYKKNIIIYLIFLFLINIFSLSSCSYNDTSNETIDSQEFFPTPSNIQNDIIIKEKPKKDEIMITMIGDNLLHESTIKTGLQEDKSYNYDHFYQYIKDDISKADIAIINQESVCGGGSIGYSGYPSFNAPFEVVVAEEKAGFDLLIHATNHAVDRGMQQVKLALDYIKNNHPNITTTGLYDTLEESEKLCIIEKNNIKVAFINYTYGLNGFTLPYKVPYAVDIFDKEKLKNKIEKAKKEADFIVALPHWGKEYEFTPTMQQRYEAQFLTDLGVDLIIGAHPHVIEPIEWLTPNVASTSNLYNHKTLCYYSIGNGVNFAGSHSRFLGLMPQIKLEKINNTTYISNIETVPLFMHLGKDNQYSLYKLVDYNEEILQNNTLLSRDPSFDINTLWELFNQVIDSRFTSFTNSTIGITENANSIATKYSTESITAN